MDIVLYDGVCGLCDRGVRWLVARDRTGRLRYAALQGETADELRERFEELPDGLDTMALVSDGRLYLRSAAAVRIAARLPWPWRVLALGWLIPKPLRDAAYRFVASNRYRWFGTKDACTIPAPEERQLFLP